MYMNSSVKIGMVTENFSYEIFLCNMLPCQSALKSLYTFYDGQTKSARRFSSLSPIFDPNPNPALTLAVLLILLPCPFNFSVNFSSNIQETKQNLLQSKRLDELDPISTVKIDFAGQIQEI